MSRRGTKEEFIEKARTIHGDKFNYSKADYRGALSKIEIICQIHGSFWQRAVSHVIGHGCSKCKYEEQNSNTKEFILKAKQIHGSLYDYSETIYGQSKEKIIVICRIHGKFKQRASGHLKGKGCNLCAIDASKIGREDFIRRANEKHNNKYGYEQVVYETNKITVIIYCHIHGEFKQAPNDHLSGAKCPGCSREEANQKLTLTTQEFIEQANIRHNDYYLYSKAIYTHSHEHVIIICPKHGDFSQAPYNHLRGTGCPECFSNISKIEMEWLDYLNIPQEYRHPKKMKIGKQTIKPDAFDPHTNTIYEFYGDYWHGNPKVFSENETNLSNKRSFGELFKNTKQREILLKEAGYNIITIWENDWKEIRKEIK
jgi:G:T-mismatch repair DNA endonuclease (very short patch repair protein)